MFQKDNAVDFRAIEFFAGVGGFATAWPEIVCRRPQSISIKRLPGCMPPTTAHPFWIREIESIATEELGGVQGQRVVDVTALPTLYVAWKSSRCELTREPNRFCG